MNYGPGLQGMIKASVPQDDNSGQTIIPVVKKRKQSDVNGKENISSSKDQKKIQYNLISQFVGMEVIEFSKWVLAATPSEREKVLRDYKKRKEKRPNG